MVLWPLSTSLKHCLIPPLSTYIHLSFTLFPFLPACLYTPTSLYDSLSPSTHPLLYPPFIRPLTSVHTPVHASMMECTKPWILGITSTDFLSSLTLLSSLHASFPLYSSFLLNFSLYHLHSLYPSTDISFSFYISICPAVYPVVNNPSVPGRIVGLIERTQSFLFTLSEVIYTVMWSFFCS